MTQVATRAGVSQATVSFVLGGRADHLKISQQTRDRVLEAAQELGYRRNQLARAMTTGKSRILGVLTTPDSGENVIRILTGAVQAASLNDYLVKVIHLSHSVVDETTIARCMEWRLAGALAVGLREETTVFMSDALRGKNMPIVMVDNAPATSGGIRVISDDKQGMRHVIDHLVGLNHREIAFLGGRPGYLSSWREQSFRAALAHTNLSVPDHWVRHTSWGNQEIIEEGVNALFRESGANRPTAVVCCGDSIAMVVQRIARSLGMHLPHDLSVAGYSNAPLSSFADPSLTTVDQSFHEMGHAAALHLIRCAENNDLSQSDMNPHTADILLPTRLIARKSTATAPSITVGVLSTGDAASSVDFDDVEIIRQP